MPIVQIKMNHVKMEKKSKHIIDQEEEQKIPVHVGMGNVNEISKTTAIIIVIAVIVIILLSIFILG